MAHKQLCAINVSLKLSMLRVEGVVLNLLCPEMDVCVCDLFLCVVRDAAAAWCERVQTVQPACPAGLSPSGQFRGASA